jgi:hypothetical protein
MESPLVTPALAADAPAALGQPIPTPATVPLPRKRMSDTVNSVLYYGLVAFGVVFPVVATIYALIVY